MKKEDYVSLECAKLLREKEFNEYCGAYYHLNWDDMTEEECFEVAPNYDFRNKDNVYRVAAPTLYEAQKWLRGRGYYVEVGIYEKYVWAFGSMIPNDMHESRFCHFVKRADILRKLVPV